MVYLEFDLVLGSSELHVANPLIIKKYLNSNFTDVTFSVTKRRNHGYSDFMVEKGL